MWHAILDIVRALEGRALLWQDAALVWCAVPTVVSSIDLIVADVDEAVDRLEAAFDLVRSDAHIGHINPVVPLPDAYLVSASDVHHRVCLWASSRVLGTTRLPLGKINCLQLEVPRGEETPGQLREFDAARADVITLLKPFCMAETYSRLMLLDTDYACFTWSSRLAYLLQYSLEEQNLASLRHPALQLVCRRLVEGGSTRQQDKEDALALVQNLSELDSVFSPPAVRLQLVSDLHLEAPRGLWMATKRTDDYATFELPVEAPYLALLGDVGLVGHAECLDFVRRQAQAYRKVFWVCGNHEFYDSTQAATRSRALELEKELQGRLVIMDRRRIDLPDSNATLLGCTLWSDVLPNQAAAVEKGLADFKRIRGFGTAEYAASHRADLDWLLQEVGRVEAAGRDAIVLTHHSPLVLPQHATLPNYSAFSTELLPRFADFARLRVWAFGHTHLNVDQVVSSLRVVSNQRGYDHDFVNDFRPGFVLEL